jgi:hypothetical protein
MYGIRKKRYYFVPIGTDTLKSRVYVSVLRNYDNGVDIQLLLREFTQKDTERNTFINVQFSI